MIMNKHGQTPYTYILGWTKYDTWYYGARWANRVPPEDDLLSEYHTSSKYVKEFISENGPPDVSRVMRTFSTPKEARDHEARFIQRFRCYSDNNPRWLNKGVPNGKAGNYRPHSERTKRLIGEKSKERWKDPEFRKKAIRSGYELSQEQKDEISRFQKEFKNLPEQKIKQSEKSKEIWTRPEVIEKARASHAKFWSSDKGQEAKERIRKIHTGKVVSEETRAKLRAARVGYKQEVVTCPHCSKIGNKSIMARWHMDNCKKK